MISDPQITIPKQRSSITTRKKINTITTTTTTITNSSTTISILFERNDFVFYFSVVFLILAIVGIWGKRFLFINSSSLPSQATSSHPQKNQVKSPTLSPKQNSNNNSKNSILLFHRVLDSLSKLPSVKPPSPDLFVENSYHLAGKKNSSYFSASNSFRLIPRSDTSGQETALFRNLSAVECAAKCIELMPLGNCNYFVRDVHPMGVSQIISNQKFFNKNLVFGRKWNDTQSILHPLQARGDEYLFATLEEEAYRLGARSRLCSLRVGLLDPRPDVRMEIWVPSRVEENFLELATKSSHDAQTFLKLDRKTGEYYSFVKPKRKSALPVSSLIAVGLLAGAPHLHQRVFPALETWLRNEPNVVAFIDRSKEAMIQVHDVLMMAAAVPTAAKTQRHHRSFYNPLFACVSTAHLQSLYKYYPEAGGDSFDHILDGEDDDWDSEMMSLFSCNNNGKKSSRQKYFFCNEEHDDNDDDDDDERIPGINFPIATSLLFSSFSSIHNIGQTTTTTKTTTSALLPKSGFTLFRFIREPHHKILKHFNGAWKNFIVLHELAIFYPTAQWYFSVDDDAMVMWKNLRYILLLGSLSSLHRRRDDLYGGYLEYGDNIYFAHGGGGMLISSATMWNRLHKQLPKCLALCRQSYGDVRVGCCMRASEIYERKWNFIWPFVLEKCPERVSNLLVSVHRYQNLENIVRIYTGMEREWRRKMMVVRNELVFSKNKSASSSSSSNSALAAHPNVVKTFSWKRHVDLQVRRRKLELYKNISRNQEIVVNHAHEYAATGILLFDELLWAAEFWRLSTGKRQVRPRVP